MWCRVLPHIECVAMQGVTPRALLAWAHGYAGNSAAARTGEPVPPTHFKG